MAALSDNVLSHLGNVLAVSKTREIGPSDTTTMDAVDHLPRIGERFLTLARLGRGGMSDVYRARDLESGREVALKIQHAGDAWLDARFEREAHALCLIDDHRVVRYVAHGRTSDDVLWIALEILRGQTLADHLAARSLSLEEALAVTRDAAGGLDALHARGFVHRDVKPANLFFDAESGETTLIDLGLLGEVNVAGLLTAPGSLLGTVGYLSPEQVRADAQVGPAADLFALGCVLFECLTRTLPFGTSMAEVSGNFAMGATPPLQRLARDTPDEVRALLRDLLRLDPAARPRSASAVSERIHDFLGKPSMKPDDPRSIDHLMSATLDVEPSSPADKSLPFGREGHPAPVRQQPPAFAAPVPPPPIPPESWSASPSPRPRNPPTAALGPEAFQPPAATPMRYAPPIAHAAPTAAPQIYAAAQGLPAPIDQPVTPPPRVAEALGDKSKVQSAFAASNAASRKEEAAPKKSLAALAEAKVETPPAVRLDLLSFDRTMVAEIRGAKLLGEGRSKRLDDQWTETPKAGAEERERADVFRVLSRGEPTPIADLGATYDRALDGGKERVIVLVAGVLEIGFDPLEALRATLGVVTPFLASDKRLKDTYDAALEAMKTPGGIAPAIAASHRERLDDAFRQAARGATSGIDGVIERSLIETRSFARRRVFGSQHVRAMVHADVGRDTLPLYLTESFADELPLVRSIPVRVIAEIRPSQDGLDAHALCLRGLALARALKR